MSMKLPNKPGKFFNDPVHGMIECNWILVKIINTPEFQRLHNIKQLSSTFHVYPEAQHSRFGHSIGTAHLAGKLARHLQQEHQEMGIEDVDVLCVEIAGLCHDLGHGPFSHLFDLTILPRLKVEGWKHEKQSTRMFDEIVKRFKSEVDKDKFIDEFFTKRNCTFIKEMIFRPKDNYQGRDEKKQFLYEIISNKLSGVDVDKFDYFARDCLHLGIANDFNHERLMKYTRVKPVPEDNDKLHICISEKEAFNLYEMFHARFRLHKRAYQHVRKNVIDHMISDTFCLAAPYIEINGTKGLIECSKEGNEKAFLYLDDRILLQIQLYNGDDNPHMTEAREILERISLGDHYRFVCNQIIPTGSQAIPNHEEIRNYMENDNNDLQGFIRITVVKFDYGKKEEDPIKSVWFYSDDNENTTSSNSTEVKKKTREKISSLLPSTFQEHVIQVFCTDSSKVKDAKTAFQHYCTHHSIEFDD